MKKLIWILILCLSACSDHRKKTPVEVANGLITPEILWTLGRVGNVVVSPDGKKVLYSVGYPDIEENQTNNALYSMNVDGSDLKQIAPKLKSLTGGVIHPDGKHIGFLSPDKQGENQFFQVDIDGKNLTQISTIAGGIEGLNYSPDGKKVLYVKKVKRQKPLEKLYKNLDKTTGRINEGLMYREWDTWTDSYPHPFLADFDGKKLSNDIDLLSGTEFASPMPPNGGMEQLAWSPDSEKIAYTCKKLVGKENTLSTNSDIYLYDINDNTTQNLSEGMMGYDRNPVFSSDGKMLAWESMMRNGYEADKNRVAIYEFSTKQAKIFTDKFDQDASHLCWSRDNQQIYFISPWHGVNDIYALTLSNISIKRVTNGTHDYLSLNLSGNELIAARQSMSEPADIFSVSIDDGKEAQISFVNKDLLAQIKMGKVEERWVKTTDDKEMLVWVIFPPDFDPAKHYPALLYCMGGPQIMVSQNWSYRWNFQTLAAHGYIIVAPNRRGVPGFGKEWVEEISGNYGGQNMNDYLSAIDAVSKEPYVDKNRLGCAGASYGGFSVYWLAGHHNKRFKAFIAHHGSFNLEEFYSTTDQLWFVNWDLGGPFWDYENPAVQRSYSNSPDKFIDKWDTPIMVIHSELDYRVVVAQGIAAYNDALLRGIPARFLYFPDENHWVLKPQNSILWYRCFFDWLDKYLKASAPKL